MTIPPPQPGRPYRVRVADGGRIVIPAELRKELGIDEGHVVILSLDGSELRIATLGEAIRKVQAYFRGLGSPEVIWSETVTGEHRGRKDVAVE